MIQIKRVKYGYDVELCNEKIGKIFGKFKPVLVNGRIVVFEYNDVSIRIRLFPDELYIIVGNFLLKISESFFEMVGGNVRFFNGNFEWTLNLTKGRIEVNITNVQRCFEKRRFEINRIMKKLERL